MKIHWLRVVVAAFLYEVVLVALTIPVVALFGMEAFVPWVAPTCFVIAIPFGWWVARKVQSGFVLHGILIAVVASLIYFSLILGQMGSVKPVYDLYGPVHFFLANAAKFAGCIAGTVACGRRRVARPAVA